MARIITTVNIPKTQFKGEVVKQLKHGRMYIILPRGYPCYLISKIDLKLEADEEGFVPWEEIRNLL